MIRKRLFVISRSPLQKAGREGLQEAAQSNSVVVDFRFVPTSKSSESPADLSDAVVDFLLSEEPANLADAAVLVVCESTHCLRAAFQPAIEAEGGAWTSSAAREMGLVALLLVAFPQLHVVVAGPPPVPGSSRDWRAELLSELAGSAAVVSPIGQSSAALGADFRPEALEGLHVVDLTAPAEIATLVAHYARDFAPVFDPCGFRSLVRAAIVARLDFGVDPVEDPARTRLWTRCVCVDDERDFALLVALAAWRAGSRCFTVVNWRGFAEGAAWRSSRNDVATIVLRDLDLRFPGAPVQASLDGASADLDLANVRSPAWLGNRSDWPRDWVFRVISADPRVVRSAGWARDPAVRGEGQMFRRRRWTGNAHEWSYLGLRKPVRSAHAVSELVANVCQAAAGLPRVTGAPTVAARVRERLQRGRGHHAAPPLQIRLAEMQLRQARALLSCDGVLAKVIAAVLAEEAWEILRGTSRTTALEALAVLHRAEASAEVTYLGVASGLTVAERVAELEATFRGLRWPRSLQRSFLSQLWGELKILYRDGEQFQAAEEANAESLVHSRWFPVGRERRSEVFYDLGFKLCARRLMLAPFVRMRWWFVAFIALTLGLSVAYRLELGARDMPLLDVWFNVVSDSLTLGSSEGALHDALSKALDESVCPGASAPPWTPALPWAIRATRVLHFATAYVAIGVFISMVYRKVTRG